MATVGRKDLIGFILAAENNPDLTLQFLSQEDEKALYGFFQSNRFTDISMTDCADIIECMRLAKGVTIDVAGIAASTTVKCY